MNWLHIEGQTLPIMSWVAGDNLWNTNLPWTGFSEPALQWNIPLSSFKPPRQWKAKFALANHMLL